MVSRLEMRSVDNVEEEEEEEEEEEDLAENCLFDTMTPPVTLGVGVSSITVWCVCNIILI